MTGGASLAGAAAANAALQYGLKDKKKAVNAPNVDISSKPDSTPAADTSPVSETPSLIEPEGFRHGGEVLQPRDIMSIIGAGAQAAGSMLAPWLTPSRAPPAEEDTSSVPPSPSMQAHGGMIRGADKKQYDTVPAMLSPGEVVLPRSVTQSDDPEGRAAAFVKHVRRSKGGKLAKGGKVAGYGDVLGKVRALKEQILALEKHLA